MKISFNKFTPLTAGTNKSPTPGSPPDRKARDDGRKRSVAKADCTEELLAEFLALLDCVSRANAVAQASVVRRPSVRP